MLIKSSNHIQKLMVKMCPSTEGVKMSARERKVINPFRTRTLFHIHSAYYLVILYSFRNLCGRLN
ncbi:hypothetical protein E2C01_022830 [Portunus trituberculatus]|uniref:Uncharacterized protein n=1 Tax=Portunus trituberculatus TaxID=210409 RepID=A0A5B7E851_PORTR|nr:hypothetical protein [Portunus trituberculatus]